jgi:hypothetical protein
VLCVGAVLCQLTKNTGCSVRRYSDGIGCCCAVIFMDKQVKSVPRQPDAIYAQDHILNPYICLPSCGTTTFRAKLHKLQEYQLAM